MRVTSYIGLSVNGMIAKASGVSDWGSNERVQGVITACQKTKAVIMGKTTYDQLAPDNLPLKEQGTTVVLTHETSLKPANSTVLFTHETPKEIIAMLEKKGYQEVVVIGGSKTVSAFMSAGVIDEIYFDFEPFLFGNGLPVFKEVDFEYKLKLLEMKKLNTHTIQLHYQIVK